MYARYALACLLLLTLSSARAGLYGGFSAANDLIEDPTPEHFSVCFQQTCTESADIGLSEAQWAEVRRIFTPQAPTAAAERERIAEAIAYLERVVGKLINAENDKRGDWEGMFATGNQLDCVDEATNTTTYLTLIERDGLLRWHRVEDTSTRGFFIFGFPHTTAVVREKGSGQTWAVDSWFRDNGVPPDILPLSQWKDGWSPEEFPGF